MYKILFMKGVALKKNDKWVVKYPKYPTSNKIFDTEILEFVQEDQPLLDSKSDTYVEFTVVSVESKKLAKLI